MSQSDKKTFSPLPFQLPQPFIKRDIPPIPDTGITPAQVEADNLRRQLLSIKKIPSVRDYAYPFQIINQDLLLAEDWDVVDQEIRSVIETLVKERVANPYYGRTWYVFELLSQGSELAELTRITIEEQVPSLLNLQVVATPQEDGVLNLTIQYDADKDRPQQITYQLSI